MLIKLAHREGLRKQTRRLKCLKHHCMQRPRCHRSSTKHLRHPVELQRHNTHPPRSRCQFHRPIAKLSKCWHHCRMHVQTQNRYQRLRFRSHQSFLQRRSQLGQCRFRHLLPGNQMIQWKKLHKYLQMCQRK